MFSQLHVALTGGPWWTRKKKGHTHLFRTTASQTAWVL
jgi:hypothetical protein